MTLAPKTKSNRAVALYMVFNDACSRWEHPERFNAQYFDTVLFSVWRILEWFDHGNNGAPRDPDVLMIEETNQVIRSVLAEEKVDIREFQSKLEMLLVASPFIIDDENIRLTRRVLGKIRDGLRQLY